MTVFRGPKGELISTLGEWETLVGGKWADGRSAKRLAETWLPENGFPARVSALLDKESSLANLAVTTAIAEHRAKVPGEGPGSATDLMVHAKSESTSISIAVEGKVDEGFDKLVSDWLLAGKSANSPKNRTARVSGMAAYFGLTAASVSEIRYQLIHRTYAAAKEAEKHGHDQAMLMVHSFSPDGITHPGWDDFVAWAHLLRDVATDPIPDRPWRCRTTNGRPLWFLWVSDLADPGSLSHTTGG